MQSSLYHIVLRIAALTLAFVLIFDSGLLSGTTAQLSQNTQEYVAAAIGMRAAVEPTELNQYTAELTTRDRVLTEREAAVSAREIEVGLIESGASRDYSTYIISILLFIILVLIIINYVLDYVRMTEQLGRRKDAKTS